MVRSVKKWMSTLCPIGKRQKVIVETCKFLSKQPISTVLQVLLIISLFFNTFDLSLHSIFKTGTMYAIVDIAGQQLKVAKDQYVYTPRIEGEAGTAVNFDKVLLVDNEGAVQVGSPLVKGVKVSGKILEHVKGDKLIVFKKKRRKGYAKKNGHRQQYTKVQIESIG